MPPVLTVPGPPHAPSLRRVTSHFLWPCVINSFSGPRDKAGVNLSNKHQVINSEDRGRPCLSLSTRLGSSSPHRTSIYILFCLSLSFCLCSLEVTVTSLHPPRPCSYKQTNINFGPRFLLFPVVRDTNIIINMRGSPLSWFTAGVGVSFSGTFRLPLVWGARKPVPRALRSSAKPALVGHERGAPVLKHHPRF